MRTSMVAVLLAAACSLQPPPVDDPRPNDSCNSLEYRRYVGQPEAALAGLVFAQPVRILPFGAAMTEDYSPVRINFDLDPGGMITRVWCG